jgi:hypothetical protein
MPRGANKMIMNLTEIADYFTRLRIAGMPDNEIEIFKKAVVQTSIINNIDVLTLMCDSVKFYEELQLKNSDVVESNIIKKQLYESGVIK